MVRKRQTSGTRNHGAKRKIAQCVMGFCNKPEKRFPDICKVAFIVGKQKVVFPVKRSHFDCSGANVNA